jgi:hypothetical protein
VGQKLGALSDVDPFTETAFIDDFKPDPPLFHHGDEMLGDSRAGEDLFSARAAFQSPIGNWNFC